MVMSNRWSRDRSARSGSAVDPIGVMLRRPPPRCGYAAEEARDGPLSGDPEGAVVESRRWRGWFTASTSTAKNFRVPASQRRPRPSQRTVRRRRAWTKIKKTNSGRNRDRRLTDFSLPDSERQVDARRREPRHYGRGARERSTPRAAIAFSAFDNRVKRHDRHPAQHD